MKRNTLVNVFYYTIEALEEYIEKINYPNFQKQIFDKSINSPNRSPEDLADDFLSQLYCLKAIITITRKKPKYSHSEVQKEFFRWIDAAGIKVNNYSKNLNHYLFIINEVLEGRGENFVKQTKEKDNSGPQPSPQDYQEVYRRFNEERENPSEKKEVNISGNPDTGKETFQQIANSLSNSDRQNFRFYPSCDKTKTPNKREENNDRRGISWSNKAAIGAIILVVLGVLMLLIWKLTKKKTTILASFF